MSNVATIERKTLTATMASRFQVEESKMMATLKATAFKGNVTDEQMMSLLIVANQYGLNPFTKEIYAFPDKQNGIVPVVGVDGWSRIINSDEAFDGMEFIQDEESCTCKIYRKDRSHPISVTEWMSECKRNTQPWQSHPKRMLRHKAMIQCARLAFGFVGIYDEDEAQRIVNPERDITPIDTSSAIDTIDNAQSMEELQAAFSSAWKSYTGKAERDAITKAKDAAKTRLMNVVAES